jgi:hypothetical protein
VQENVAQLLAYFIMVILGNGITQLISLLYRIGTERFVGLLSVPRSFSPQTVHHLQQPSEGFKFFFTRMFLFHNRCKNKEKK